MPSRPRREMVTCPYCNETMTKAVHDRWHVPCPIPNTDVATYLDHPLGCECETCKRVSDA